VAEGVRYLTCRFAVQSPEKDIAHLIRWLFGQVYPKRDCPASAGAEPSGLNTPHHFAQRRADFVLSHKRQEMLPDFLQPECLRQHPSGKLAFPLQQSLHSVGHTIIG